MGCCISYLCKFNEKMIEDFLCGEFEYVVGVKLELCEISILVEDWLDILKVGWVDINRVFVCFCIEKNLYGIVMFFLEILGLCFDYIIYFMVCIDVMGLLVVCKLFGIIILEYVMFLCVCCIYLWLFFLIGYVWIVNYSILEIVDVKWFFGMMIFKLQQGGVDMGQLIGVCIDFFIGVVGFVVFCVLVVVFIFMLKLMKVLQ